MNIFQNEFEKQWEELSQDVVKLNEYVFAKSVELRNVKIPDRSLAGVAFTGAFFDTVEWVATDLEQGTFNNTIFKNCNFTGSIHWNSNFNNVVFENCTFEKAELGGSVLINVKFINCKIVDSRFKELTGNELIFEKSDLKERTSFAWSNIPIIFRKCTLDGVGLSGMKVPNSITIEDSFLEDVDFSRGHFSDVVLRRVGQSGGGVKFNDLTAKSITFEDVDMTKGTAIARSTVGYVRVSGGNFGTSFTGSNIGRIVIRDAQLSYMGFGEVNLPRVEIANCVLYDTGMWDSYIDEFIVTNSKFNIIDGENFTANTVLWDNVTLDGKVDFTNTQIKDFRPTRIQKGSSLQLITAGSNLKF